jgi:hypothetical protein
VSLAAIMPSKGLTERISVCGDGWIARFLSIRAVQP